MNAVKYKENLEDLCERFIFYQSVDKNFKTPATLACLQKNNINILESKSRLRSSAELAAGLDILLPRSH